MEENEIEATTVMKIQDEEKPEKPKRKKKKKKKLTKAGRRFFEIVLVAALAVAGYSGWQLYSGLKAYRESENEYEDLSEVVSEPVSSASAETGDRLSHVNFDALKQRNPDTVAWITLDDTPINYPVVQGSDNDYYLHHLFSGKANHNGCVFMDYRNASDFSDRNTILYAHHMLNGSMFAALEGYREQDFYETHQRLRLQTPDGDYWIYPFAGLLSDGWADYNQTSFSSDEAFLSFVNNLIRQSTFQSDVTIEAGDRIVTLSTCRYDVQNGRFAVFGKLVKAEDAVEE